MANVRDIAWFTLLLIFILLITGFSVLTNLSITNKIPEKNKKGVDHITQATATLGGIMLSAFIGAIVGRVIKLGKFSDIPFSIKKKS